MAPWSCGLRLKIAFRLIKNSSHLTRHHTGWYRFEVWIGTGDTFCMANKKIVPPKPAKTTKPVKTANTNGGETHQQTSENGVLLTTNQGLPISDNQNSLKGGSRGPTLLEDFILREKITHFDHERIPERIVHARGSGAHGYFECTRAIPELTRATVFAKKGKRTPVFCRFSTVAGSKGSKDTPRDVRGFA